jgi:uncharacterized protein YciI
VPARRDHPPALEQAGAPGLLLISGARPPPLAAPLVTSGPRSPTQAGDYLFIRAADRTIAADDLIELVARAETVAASF